MPFKHLKQKQAAVAGGVREERAAPDNQQTIAFGKRPMTEDQEMAESEVVEPEVEVEVVNGGSSVQSPVGASARHNFDAVRSSIDPGPAPNIPMEED